MADRNHVADKSTMHRYRIELPILIDDLDLSVYEFRLYVRFKRRSGDGGSCYEGTRSLAEACGMSMGQVSKAKKSLEEKGLIRIGTKQTRGGQTDDVTLVDLWPRNFKAYAQEESVHQVNTSNESVHQVNTSGKAITTRTLSPESDHHMNTLTPKRSPGERKNHDQYHIGVITTSSTSSMAADDDFFLELRKRKVGKAKAREIANMPCDPSRILSLIDNRPNASDPNSLGLLIIDILDGVADVPAPRVAKSTPLTATKPNVPDRPVAPAEMLRQARMRNDSS